MRQKKLTSLIAVTLSLELIIAPVIPSVQAQTSTTAEKFNDSINFIGQMWGDINRMNNPGAQMNPLEMQKLAEQVQPRQDKYFNAQKLSQLPGLAQYLSNNGINPNQLSCSTLPTTLTEINAEVCQTGVTNDKTIDPGSQMGLMSMYYQQYSGVNKTYKNYISDSNVEGQAFGIGCMNNAMNILNGYFKYRIDELDKLTTNLEAMQNQLKEASRGDLDAIEEAVAVLDGESDIADKVRSKKPELFDFKKRFNNPACNSMYAGEALNSMGQSRGLNSINLDMKAKLTTPDPGSPYSGQDYSQSHNSIIEDINSVADKISKQVELNLSTQRRDPKSYSEFLKDVSGSITSTTGVSDSIRLDMFADVQSKFNEKFSKFSEDQNIMASELKGSEKAMSLMGGVNSVNFEAEVSNLEKNVKNSCLKETLGSAGSRSQLMDKIYDPSSSGHANKFASNFLKDKLNQILDNSDTTIEQKLAELKALENQQGNRYYMKMENSYEIQDIDNNGAITSTVVEASSNRTPGVYFSDVIRNCNAQFKANKLGNTLTGASAIQKLREMNQEVKTFVKNQSEDIKKEIRKKMIQCTSPEIANNTVGGSCGPKKFNTSAPGFCANAALSCSKNMIACSAQAQTFVEQIKTQKIARVNNYKALVQKNKLDVVKIFDSALARYMRDGEVMRGIFGAGFSSPVGVKREVPENIRYLKDFKDATGKEGSPDGKLLLEDPDAYTNMFIGNIALLKESVRKQQDQILGGDAAGQGSRTPGLLAEHIRKTQKNYTDVASESNKIAEECRRSFDNAVAKKEAGEAAQQDDFNKKQGEMGEKRDEFCRRFTYAAANETHPGPACSGYVVDLATTQIAGDYAYRLKKLCDGTQGSSSENSNFSSKADAINLCNRINTNIETSTNENLKAACLAYKECKSSIINGADGKPVYQSSCDQEQKDAYLASVMKLSNKTPTPLGDAPAFCSGGDNSDRNTFAKGLDAIRESFASGMGMQTGAAPR